MSTRTASCDSVASHQHRGRRGFAAGWALTTSAAAAGWLVSRSFTHRLAHYQEALRRPGPSEVDVETLPALVQGWLDKVLPSERPRPALMRLSQKFEMRPQQGRAWVPGVGVEVSSGGRPGFAWFGRLRFAPLIEVQAYDVLIDGEGFLEARLLGVVPLARVSGPAATRGEVQRYLAELPWTPLAVLTNPDLRWAPAGPDSVEVSAAVRDAQGRVTLSFGPDGLPTGTYAAGRPHIEGKREVERPWRGVFSGYRDFGGLLLPAHGEVSWLLDDQWAPYWRGEVTNVCFP